METIQLMNIPISTDMMNANQISSYVESKDYTAFEVSPISTDINAGDINQKTGLEYKEKVTASMIAGVQMKTFVDQNKSDLIVDWGDGTIVCVKSATSEDGLVEYKTNDDDPSDRKVQLKHTYLESGKKYIVKIYGNDYHMFRPFCSGSGKICTRILDFDLPVASCVTDINSALEDNLMIQKVSIPRYFNWKNVTNISCLFHRCKNLIKAEINKHNSYFGHQFGNAIQVFLDCTNLKECTWRLPSKIDWETGYYQFYKNCKSLESELKDLLPCNGFTDVGITKNESALTEVFLNCSNLKGRALDYDYMLWNNPIFSINGGTNTFKECSEEMLTGVPERWGGSVTYGQFVGSQITIEAKSEGLVSVLIATRQKNKPALIDWGDGTHSHSYINADNGAVEYVKHTYQNDGTYILKISDDTIMLCVTTTDFNKIQVTEVNRIGDHVLSMQDSFVNYNKLTKVCAWGYSVNSLTRTYKDCSSISNVTELETNATPARITNHVDVVLDASDVMRALFPESWGGTKQ